jgi:hypothetical protein
MHQTLFLYLNPIRGPPQPQKQNFPNKVWMEQGSHFWPPCLFVARRANGQPHPLQWLRTGFDSQARFQRSIGTFSFCPCPPSLHSFTGTGATLFGGQVCCSGSPASFTAFLAKLREVLPKLRWYPFLRHGSSIPKPIT